MSDGKRKPIVVRVGAVTVKIYRVRPAGKPEAFQVADFSTGRRRLREFADENEARGEAARIATLLGQGQVKAASLIGGEVESYGRAMALLGPSGVSLEVAVDTFAEAFRILGGNRVLEAARGLATKAVAPAPQGVGQSVADFIASRKARGASAYYLSDLHYKLARFSRAFVCRMDEIQTRDVQKWIEGLKLGSQTQKSFRTVLHTFFEFGISRGHVLSNPVKGTEDIQVRRGTIGIFSPDEMARLLEAARATNPAVLPVLILGGFCGLRTAEIERLEWQDIRESHVVVGAHQSKTSLRRIVPILDAARAWLAICRRPVAGRIWPFNSAHMIYARQVVAEETGRAGLPAVPWRHNALRHSFASYRFAEIMDAGRVSGEMGNSARVVLQYYREIVSPEDAKRFWSLRPSKDFSTIPFAAQNAETEGATTCSKVPVVA
jgi:site-specific recombinase XerD